MWKITILSKPRLKSKLKDEDHTKTNTRVFNQSKFSGLENHIHNCYANPLFQLLRFTPILRNFALAHVAQTCLREDCLLCETGFLFDMLEKANGQNCHATNLLKTLSLLLGSSSLDEDHFTPEESLASKIQDLTKFILERITFDAQTLSEASNENPEYVVEVDENIVSFNCHHGRYSHPRRPSIACVHTLLYPSRQSHPRNTRGPVPLFSSILKASIQGQQQRKGWCRRCGARLIDFTWRQVQDVPPVLMLKTQSQHLNTQEYWARPGWLPKEIGIVVDQGQFHCFEGHDLEHLLRRGAYHVEVFELVGAVASISGAEHEKSHLVSIINGSIIIMST